MKAMVKHYTVFGSLLSLIILAAMIGCKNPTPRPPEATPIFRDGIEEWDRTATTIVPDPSGLPYMIADSDWVIDSLVTVTVRPGTEFIIRDSMSVVVNGQLLASGTEAEPIVFTSARLEPDLGDWRGIKLNNSSLDARSVFENCIFTWGALYPTDTTSVDAKIYRGMLVCNNSSPIIKHCIVAKNQNNAVFIRGELSQPIVRYNIFSLNDASAVRADTAVPLPTYLWEPGKADVSFNCVGDNSAIAFLMGHDDSSFGRKYQVNANRDSVDKFFNIDESPLFKNPVLNFVLSSCSPAIDAGPRDSNGQPIDPDPDGTRTDLGIHPYVQEGAGDLRGIVSGTLSAGVSYLMSCDVKVDSGEVLTIPAGTVIEVDSSQGLYTIEVHGRLVIEGTEQNRIRIASKYPGRMWGGIRFLGYDTISTPSMLQYADFVDYLQIDVQRAGVQFMNCRFDSAFEYGMAVSTGHLTWDDTVRVQNCTFNLCGQRAVGIYGCAATIRNSLIQNGRGRGIVFDSLMEYAAISNCLVRGNVSNGLSMEKFCSPTVVNNVFVDNGYYGIYMDNNCLPSVQNNIVYRNARYGIYVLNSSTPTLAFNDVFSNTPNYVLPPLLDPVNSISQDPMFVSETDFHLSAGSPCSDAGNPADEYRDADGSLNDMGVYGGPNGEMGVGTLRRRPSAASLASK